MLADTTGIEWGALATAAVTLILGLVAVFRPPRDITARASADHAIGEATAAKMLVESAMEMARKSSADAERASERAGLCERRCFELEQRILTCEHHREQLLAEAAGLAEIIDERIVRPETADDAAS